MARALLLTVLALTAGCTTPLTRESTITPNEILAAHAPDAAAASSPLISPAEAVALDADMRAFVTEQVGDVRDQHAKFERLLEGMDRRGLLSLEYTNDETRTAEGAFHEGRGNCLSFTMLFIALAREADLDARYQVMNIAPMWSNPSNLVVVDTHINARVRFPRDDDYIVDFNAVNPRERLSTRPISDDYALALFYNNLGAEALIRGDRDLSFRYLEAAANAHGEISDVWTNLGVLYTRLGLDEYADAAYLEALIHDPGDETALANLVSLHTRLGNETLAAAYQERIARYQRRNPYYHYAVAETAYEEARYTDALDALKRAQRLKRDEPEIMALEARVRLALAAEAQ